MKKLFLLFTVMAFVSVTSFGQKIDKLDKALRYVEQKAPQWGLSSSDIDNLLVSDMYTNKKTGVTYIYLIQGHQNIPIEGTVTSFGIAPNGKMVASAPKFIKNIDQKIQKSIKSINPVDAIAITAHHLGIRATSLPQLRSADTEKGVYKFVKPDFAKNDITVKEIYLPSGDKIVRAYSLYIQEKDKVDVYNTFVDASTGKILSKYNMTSKCSFAPGQFVNQRTKKKHTHHAVKSQQEIHRALAASNGTYNVFALPIESPIYGSRTMEVEPYFTDSSPFGWHDSNGMEGAEKTITSGNNVHAYLDKDDTGFSNNDEPDGGSDLIFDFPYHPDSSNTANEQAATVNLFYTVNMVHDIVKRLGFDEQAGNFQANNYGNGGAGNDYVLAQASDGFELETPNLNNANFFTPEDGSNGEMQMFLWENPSGILSIDEPQELQGFVNPVGTATSPTGFGPPLPKVGDAPITGKVALARDGSPTNPTTSCNDIINADEINGKIALIDRGFCDFSLKAYNAQQAGAIAVIICNVVGANGDGEDIINMAGGDKAADVNIVSLFLKKSDCDRIKASLLSDIDVTLTIQERPPMGPQYLDGAFDNGIISHEFAHGIGNRLVGGPSQVGCFTNAEQPGEGISDFFSLALTVEEGDMGTDARGIGNFATGRNTNGRGIRRYPYSTDMSVNPLTYDNIKVANNQYDVGEVWCSALWEVYWNMVDQFGLDTKWEDENAGNYIALRLIIEGMKLSPCNSSLLQLRDGILDADGLLYENAHSDILWKAFAKRGFGYLATDGSPDDITDGSESFEPEPLSIKKLKIEKSVESVVVDKGQEITITLVAKNHVPETRTGVKIIDNIPPQLTYIEGSASANATFDNGELTIDIGTMDYKDEVTVTYKARVNESFFSQRLFYDDVENPNFDNYAFDSKKGFSLWTQSFDVAHSGITSWYAAQEDTEQEVDFSMDLNNLTVTGDRPVLRFFHRYDAETGIDGGFVTISKDGIIYQDIKDKFIRNGYPIGIQYNTFAIPSLEGFSGTTNQKFIDSYIDLSEYKGETISVRFRFGTNPTGGTTADYPGWFVDDIEMIDLASFESAACIISNEDDHECTNPLELFVNTDESSYVEDTEVDGLKIAVGPNPASEYISVSIATDQYTPVNMSLRAMDGKIIRSINLYASNTEKVRTFDVAGLQSGLYLVEISTPKGVTTKKVMVK